MKRIIIILVSFLLFQCSFDNKTGIWKNDNDININQKDIYRDFKKLNTEEKVFNEIIAPGNNLKIIVETTKKNIQWLDEFYQNSNNLDNFDYNNLNEVIFKSKKLTRQTAKDKILFDGENVIATDIKGNIIIYSIENKKIVFKYNFYKKKFKKINKVLNIIADDGILYVTDNIGYTYSLSLKNQKLLWAKNYKVPFRSNLKLTSKTLVAADQNNALYIINKFNGERVKFIPTEEMTLKNDFINTLTSDDKSVIFLNTYGSIYSIDPDKYFINWFLNLNRSIDLNSSNLFYSNPISIYQDKVIVATDPYLYVMNLNTGSTMFKIAIASIVRPIVSGQNLFLITKENLLVSININTGKIIYSIKINQKIAEFLDTKSKLISIKDMAILNNNLFIFLHNSYLVKFNKIGAIQEINKLPSKIGSMPIFINDSILYLNKNNKLIILN